MFLNIYSIHIVAEGKQYCEEAENKFLEPMRRKDPANLTDNVENIDIFRSVPDPFRF